MARAPAADADAPEPDRRTGAPHPREAPALLGHEAAEREVLGALAAGRLHSGWLLSGPEGIGKATFAYRMAQTLLAGRPGAGDRLGLPDSHPDARLVRAGSHPRLLVLRRSPGDDGRLRTQITVDDARALASFLHLSAADGGHRVVLVDPADELNPSAGNALLKLLEEPPPRTTLILLAHQAGRVLPTLRSRCRSLRLAPLASPDLAAALAAIGQVSPDPDRLAALAQGSPGQALRLLEGGGLDLYADLAALLATLPRLDRARAVRLAESMGGRASDRFPLALDLLDLLLARAARAGLEGPPPEAAPGEAATLARLAPHDRAARAWAEAQARASARARAGRAVNLDPAALLLDMLLDIEQTARKAAAA